MDGIGHAAIPVPTSTWRDGIRKQSLEPSTCFHSKVCYEASLQSRWPVPGRAGTALVNYPFPTADRLFFVLPAPHLPSFVLSVTISP